MERVQLMDKKTYEIDPRAQLLILVLINIIGMANKSPTMEILSMILLAGILIWQKQWHKCVKYFVAYFIVWLLIYVSTIWPNTLTGFIVIFGVMGRKLIPVLMFASSIVASTKVSKLIAALQEIKLPKGLIIGLAVAIRFFPTIKEEGSIVINSMKMRGLSLNMKNILRHPLLVMENILLPLMMRMTIVADELSLSSITRGIDSSRTRTSYYENKMVLLDYMLILVFIGLAVVAFLEVI